MSGIRTNAAAVMLGVSPNTLRSWERRYGFPAPQRSAGGHRQYALSEIEALRLTLAETHNVSSAISVARERGEGPSSPARLVAAFSAFDEAQANRLLEDSMSLRSLERTLEEVLLQGIERMAEGGQGSPEYEFAWRHATGWMSAMKRLAPPASRREAILIRFPRGVERRERQVVVSHGPISSLRVWVWGRRVEQGMRLRAPAPTRMNGQKRCEKPCCRRSRRPRPTVLDSARGFPGAIAAEGLESA